MQWLCDYCRCSCSESGEGMAFHTDLGFKFSLFHLLFLWLQKTLSTIVNPASYTVKWILIPPPNLGERVHTVNCMKQTWLFIIFHSCLPLLFSTLSCAPDSGRAHTPLQLGSFGFILSVDFSPWEIIAGAQRVGKGRVWGMLFPSLSRSITFILNTRIPCDLCPQYTCSVCLTLWQRVVMSFHRCWSLRTWTMHHDSLHSVHLWKWPLYYIFFKILIWSLLCFWKGSWMISFSFSFPLNNILV